VAISQPFSISKKSQEGLKEFHKYALRALDRQYRLREFMEEIDRSYLREDDYTKEHRKAQQANRYGDKDRLQNITVPVIKPQVDSAVNYQAAVFLQDYPLFGVIAAPQFINEAKQFQAVIEENSIRAGWSRELLLFFRKAFRYNLAALEVSWDKIATAAIETDVAQAASGQGRPKQIIWQGNVLKSWDMYNTYFDTRCLPYDIPAQGEFAGHTQIMSKSALASFIQRLDIAGRLIENIPAAFNSPSLIGSASGEGYSYYIPVLNPDTVLDNFDRIGEDWDGWVGLKQRSMGGVEVNYKNLYEVSTEYVRIMPIDFDIKAPSPKTPQIWKIIWVNHCVPIYVERQTNAHEKLPVLFAQPYEDGLGYQTKSLAKDAQPFQDVASALMNSIIASRRRAATDRVLYDPSRISEAHINSPNPAAKIPVRPSAYGKPVGEAVYPFPFRDDQAGIAMQEIQSVVQFGNILLGQNQARQGQFVKGNKTDGQWDTVMSNATSNDQATALLLEAQVFTPLKEILKLNILQYQQRGTYYSPSQKGEVAVDPLALRQAIINFKVTDGLLPKEKIMKTDTLKVAMQAVANSQSLSQAYNIGPMFSYIMKTENVDLSPFEKSPQQLAYEQAVGQWTQLAQLAIQKGTPFNTPQPLPEQFGFDPATQDPAARQAGTQ
jgi:hypothetical protein